MDAADVGSQLQRADIVLAHDHGLVARAIQTMTKSYWNHVAIVFVLGDLPSRRREGYQHTFVLEASPRQGVDIHSIEKYLQEDGQDIAILRFRPELLPKGTNFQRRVRGFALEEIDSTYGFDHLIAAGLRAISKMTWHLAVTRADGSRRKAINRFTCSGVVQYAYLRACYGPDFEEPKGSDFFGDPRARMSLILSDSCRNQFDPQEPFQVLGERLKLTVPADFARAVAQNLLICVGQRIGGQWSAVLTRE